MTFSATARQADLLRFVAGFIEAHGYGPSHREMAEAIGCPKGRLIHQRILALEERGLLRRLPNRNRAIEPLVHVPIPRGPHGEPLYFVQVRA